MTLGMGTSGDNSGLSPPVVNAEVVPINTLDIDGWHDTQQFDKSLLNQCESQMELVEPMRVTQWTDSSGTHVHCQKGTYHERTVEESTNEVNTDQHGFSVVRSCTRISKELIRQGIESASTCLKYMTRTSVTFEPCQRWVQSQQGLRPIAVAHLQCYRDLAAITRVIPSDGQCVSLRNLPWVDGIIGKSGDLLDGHIPTPLPAEVIQEIQRFDQMCATGDPSLKWEPSNNKWVAACASAVVTTPMFMKAYFQGQVVQVMVDCGAAVSIYADSGSFPGVPYQPDITPIAITGVTGESMLCRGLLEAPLILSVDGFTDTTEQYGAFTVQSGFTGKVAGIHDTVGVQITKSKDSLGLNHQRTHITIKFRGYHFPDAGPKTPILGMDYFSKQFSSDRYSVPHSVDFLNGCLRFQQPNNCSSSEWGLAKVPVHVQY